MFKERRRITHTSIVSYLAYAHDEVSYPWWSRTCTLWWMRYWFVSAHLNDGMYCSVDGVFCSISIVIWQSICSHTKVVNKAHGAIRSSPLSLYDIDQSSRVTKFRFAESSVGDVWSPRLLVNHAFKEFHIIWSLFVQFHGQGLGVAFVSKVLDFPLLSYWHQRSLVIVTRKAMCFMLQRRFYSRCRQ